MNLEQTSNPFATITRFGYNIFILLFIVYLCNTNELYSQKSAPPELNAEVQTFYSKVGIRLLRPSEKLTHPSQHFYEMQISLSEQQKRGLLSSELEIWDTRKGLPGNPTLLSDNFEREFPGNTWQLLKAPGGGDWGKNKFNPASGSFSLWCGKKTPLKSNDATRDYPNNSLTWLIAGPYGLSQTKFAALNFYAWIKSQLDFDVFFWGASSNGVDFFGIGTSGDSQGWQFVNFNLNEVPGLGKVVGSPKVWIAFFFVSDATTTDEGVFIDNIKLTQDINWQQEYVAVIDGNVVPNAYSGGIGLARPAFVDIDNDQDYDLFVGEYDGNLNHYRNDGSKTNPVWTYVDGNYAEIDVGENSAPTFVDLDEDGDYDLFIGDSEGTVSLFENIGTRQKAVWNFVGKLRDSKGQLIDAGTTSTPAFVDLDKDGDLDLFIGDTEGYLSFYRNESQSTEMSWALVSKNYLGIDVGYLSAPTFADIDGDGDFDLFTGIREKTIFFYENTGTTNEPKFLLSSKNFGAIEVGDVTSPAFVDIDGDGDLDLCIAQAEGSLDFFINQGKEFKRAPQRFDLQTIDVGFQCAPALVDIDHDGDLDLLLGSASGKFHFYKNVGDAKSPKWKVASELFDEIEVKEWSTPAFVDIDGDGDLDLFSGSKGGRIYFFQNDGSKANPHWTLVSDYYDSLLVGGQTYPTFADIDADGDFDLFVGTDIYGISFFENRGSRHKPNWELVTRDFLGLRYIYRATPVFVDIDKDGDLDLLAGSHGGTMIFCENIGDKKNPNFKLITTKYNDMDVRFFSIPTFGDIDIDGDLDLFLGNNSGGLNFWRNLTDEPTQVDHQADLIRKVNQTQTLIYFIPTPYPLGTTLQYQLLQDSEVRIKIYNLQGDLVNTLVEKFQPKGVYSIQWDGQDLKGRPVPEGLYFLQVSADGYSKLHKLVLTSLARF